MPGYTITTEFHNNRIKEAPLGEILRAAVRCIQPPSLFPRELHMLADIARNADDHSGPVLDTDGTVREARRGYVRGLGDPKDKLGLKANLLETRMFIFTATGWLAPAEGPEHDGAYQLNVPRLRRLLDATEAAMATGQPDADAIAEADRELPGDFDGQAPDLADQVDRLLVRNPAA